MRWLLHASTHALNFWYVIYKTRLTLWKCILDVWCISSLNPKVSIKLAKVNAIFKFIVYCTQLKALAFSLKHTKTSCIKWLKIQLKWFITWPFYVTCLLFSSFNLNISSGAYSGQKAESRVFLHFVIKGWFSLKGLTKHKGLNFCPVPKNIYFFYNNDVPQK